MRGVLGGRGIRGDGSRKGDGGKKWKTAPSGKLYLELVTMAPPSL